MMKEKILCVALVLLLSCLGAACAPVENEPPHTHQYAAEWTFDTETHWHAATCEHTGEKSGEAPHDIRDDKCTVCGYRAGMELADFADRFSAQGKAFAENTLKNSFHAEILSELVFFKVNEKGELTELAVVYTGEKSATATESAKSHEVYLLTAGIAPVYLDDIADGTVTEGDVTSTSSLALFTYEKDVQAASRQLADAVVRACAPDAARTPLLRLYGSFGYEDGKHLLRVLDLYEDGWTRFSLSVGADESADPETLAGALADGSNCSDIKIASRNNYGTAVYFNITE